MAVIDPSGYIINKERIQAVMTVPHIQRDLAFTTVVTDPDVVHRLLD
jgi:hypothetical protein